MKCCAKVAGYFYREKERCEPRRHGDTENTEAKQKEVSHFRKKFHVKTRRRNEKGKRLIVQIDQISELNLKL